MIHRATTTRKVDAALWRDSNSSIYLFHGTEYARWSNVDNGMDKNYPMTISARWRGMPASFNNGLDAALMRKSNGKIYLFKGNSYARFSSVSDGMDKTEPIQNLFKGLPPDWHAGIDAALWRDSNSSIYLFRGPDYVRFSDVSKGMDRDYPKPIAGGWKGMPNNFNQGIDAALMRHSTGRIYLFKGDDYVRFSSVAAGMDEGYPQPISSLFIPFPWKSSKPGDSALAA